ncbi:DUF3841 domain-containing protein [Hungatella hathewayi]|uniref:DUF3841 domain-containing protein n=1 Tax=Hungatella hathewayi TaxID=154046 RepID=UPI0035627F13
MRLWTFQPIQIYEKLKQEFVLYVDENKIKMFHFDDMDDFISKNVYDYMVNQMKQSLSRQPMKAEYPWWAWYKTEGKNKEQDLSKQEFHYAENMVCLELEIPKNQVLLSDEELWYCSLNNCPLILEEDDKKWDDMYS